MLERDNRMNAGPGVSLHPAHPSQQPGGSQMNTFPQQQHPTVMSQEQSLQLQTQQLNKDTRDPMDMTEPQQLTAIFRPDSAGEWKERFERARTEKFSQQGQPASGISAWDSSVKDDEDDGKDEDPEIDDDDTASTSGEDDGKIWRPRRTLRKCVACLSSTYKLIRIDGHS